MIFADTSFFVGYVMRRDSRHADAHALSDRFVNWPVATSELVLGETWTTLRNRIGHVATVSWIDTVRALPATTIHRIDDPLADEAWSWLRRHDERPYSFVDATSFALMRKLRITDALAFDGDFAAAGFNELRV